MRASTPAKKFASTPMTPLFIVEDADAVVAPAAEEVRGYKAPGDTEFTYFDFC
jgi:hypothetical protein